MLREVVLLRKAWLPRGKDRCQHGWPHAAVPPPPCIASQSASLARPMHPGQVRYDRITGELQKLRGDGSLPDFEAEEALRDALVATEAQKQQVGALGSCVVRAASGETPPAGCCCHACWVPRHPHAHMRCPPARSPTFTLCSWSVSWRAWLAPCCRWHPGRQLLVGRQQAWRQKAAAETRTLCWSWSRRVRSGRSMMAARCGVGWV